MSQTTAQEILARWPEVSQLDPFRRRLFLEDFGSVWNKVWNKNLSFREIFAHKLFMRMFTTLDHSVSDREGQTIFVIDGVNGRLGIKVARHYPLSRVMVAAPDPDSASVIKILVDELGLSNVDIKHASLPKTGLTSESYDVVVTDLISHPKVDYELALKDLGTLVKPGGRLAVFAPNRANVVYRLYKTLAGREFAFNYAQSFNRAKMEKLVKKAGMKRASTTGFELGYLSYTSDKTTLWELRFGKVANKAVKTFDHLFNNLATNNFGFGLLTIGEKEGDRNTSELAAMDEIIRDVRKSLPSDKDIKRVEIIILKYRDPEVEWKCAKNILENTEWPYKLNMFDNRPGTKNMSKIWNKLIRESTCDYLIIMDSDIFVPKLGPCWLTRLMSTFIDEHAYVALPKVTVTSSAQQKASKPKDGPAELATERFAGMCTLYKKEVFEKVGYFDEDFLLRGSDTEWAQRFLKSGLKGYYRPDVVVEHVGSVSTKKADRKAEYSRALERIYANTMYNEKLKK
ncbi:MAG: hypothetical protein Q7T49_02485 [bacterium]|nr:hypothetical protein [bacterium]